MPMSTSFEVDINPIMSVYITNYTKHMVALPPKFEFINQLMPYNEEKFLELVEEHIPKSYKKIYNFFITELGKEEMNILKTQQNRISQSIMARVDKIIESGSLYFKKLFEVNIAKKM